MVTEVNAVHFCQNLGEMINQVQYRNDSIIITKDDKAVAALVDAGLFVRIRRLRTRFDELSDRISQAYDNVSPEEGLAEIDAAVGRARHRWFRFTLSSLTEPRSVPVTAHAETGTGA